MNSSEKNLKLVGGSENISNPYVYTAEADGSLDLETSDSDLIAYGIRNTKTSTPFTVGDGASEVAIEIDLSHEPDFKSKTLAVMTVRQDCAASVRDLVKVKKGANLQGFPMHFETVNEEIDGVASVVVKAVFERKGFIVSFR